MTTRAELSSLTTSLDEIARRVTALADTARTSHDEDLATELFSVERALNGALRRLRRVSGAAQ